MNRIGLFFHLYIPKEREIKHFDRSYIVFSSAFVILQNLTEERELIFFSIAKVS
jgi:hypothetical protein